jgi:uncharacterized protein (TIGR02271 family)
MAEHIVAVFRTEEAATAAKQSLLSVGIHASAIRQYVANETNRDQLTPMEHTTTRTAGGGFWAWLFGEESTSETTLAAYRHDAYDRTAAAGNVVLGVRVDEDSQIHQAITALEAHDPLDIDEHADEGDAGATSIAPPAVTSTVGRDYSSSDVVRAGETDAAIPSGRAATPMAPITAAPTSKTTSLPAGVSPPAPGTPSLSPTPGTVEIGAAEQVVPLSEEQLEVGKRTVDRGTTRIRRYVVEKPVEESVNLRTERVTVERRQPLESTAAPGAGAFEERVVEVRETAEEPVVSKTAHVAEEVVIGRESTERTETVRDTVRREDVEITKDGAVKP